MQYLWSDTRDFMATKYGQSVQLFFVGFNI